MDEENFFKGIFWGVMFSVPLWLAIFGWINLVKQMLD